ncbi:MAG: hypothetical protein BGO31_07280 [Bacteroidetes bacterium 43-16]|nr:MAG: hypothetical protein BGO31_07280 [Bacteroidetes bacterium 43-16]
MNFEKLSVGKFTTLSKEKLQHIVGGDFTGGGSATLDEKHETWVDQKGNIQTKSSYFIRNYLSDDMRNGTMCFTWEGEGYWTTR